MPSDRKRLMWMLLALALTFFVLFASYRLYTELKVDRPLAQALGDLDDVGEVTLTKTKAGVRIRVALGPTSDLGERYVALDEAVSAYLGTGSYEIQIEDTSTQELDDAYHAIHFFVEEAACRGTFGEMAQESSKKLESIGITDYKLSVDDRRIYVQILSADRYLYKVVHRRNLEREGGTA